MSDLLAELRRVYGHRAVKPYQGILVVRGVAGFGVRLGVPQAGRLSVMLVHGVGRPVRGDTSEWVAADDFDAICRAIDERLNIVKSAQGAK